MVTITRRRVEAVVVAVLIVALGVLAFTHRGLPASQVDFHDGGVWVTNQQERLLGHLNYESQTMDGAMRMTASEFDVTQSGSNVLVRSQDTVQPVDASSLTFQSEAGVAGVQVAHGGDQVLFADVAEGRIWATSTVTAGQFSLTTEPLLKALTNPRVLVGADGTGYAVTAEGQVHAITGHADSAQVNHNVATVPADLSAFAQLTVVGNQLAVLDGQVLTVGRHTITDEAFTEAKLQLPSEPSGFVLLATASELIRVEIATGAVHRESVGMGTPSAPVQLDGCSYGLWAGSGYYVRDCGPSDYEEAQFPELAAASELVFRINRDVVVINDVTNGDVYLPLKGMVKVDNWQLVAGQLDDQVNESDDETTDKSQVQEFNDEQTPPIAYDDELGARAGTSSVLPVLLNDVDQEGDVLTAKLVSVPEGVTITPTRQGRALRIDLPEDAPASLSFTYQAFDGIAESNVATATIKIRHDDGNAAPRMVRSPSVTISERGAGSYAALADWVDPDGDLVFLERAEADENTELTWRPDGFVGVKDLGLGGPGRRAVVLTVSDGVDASSGELGVQVIAGSTNSPPVANNDHIVVVAGETATLDPRRNDTDADSDPLKLVEVSAAPTGLEVKPNYQDGTIRLTGSQPGSYSLIYAISDGPNGARGRIRVDVVDPNQSPPAPVAESDLVLLSPGGSAVVSPLNNDYDPSGGVLVVQGYDLGAAKGISVEVVRHSLLRVTAPAGLDEPQTFTYIVSNGHASTTAKVLVVPKPPTTPQPPVALADTATVRAGDVLSVPVLANDYSPSDLDLSLTATLDVRSDPALGEFFLADNTVRFLAGSQPGVAEAFYTVQDTHGNVATATVTITIRPIDELNRQPVPAAIEARTLAGSSVAIPVPLDGIDPDGDSVTLVGPGDQAPKLGAITIEGNQIIYKPNENTPGTDTFTYRVQDRFGAEGVGQVRVGVAPAPEANQSPVAVPDEVSARPSTRLEIPALLNDFDPDGDKVEFVAGTVASAVEGWEPEIQVTQQRIVVVTPSEPGHYQLVYSNTDGRGLSAQGVVNLTVDPTVAPVAPVARDDVVLPSAINGVDEVKVSVLDNDSDPDGAVADLVVTASAPAVVNNGVITLPVADERQIVLYTITDPDGMSSQAVIVVPGREAPPQVDITKEPPTVIAGQPLTINVADWVLCRPGRSAKITSVDSVTAGPGGDPTVGSGGVEVLSDTTLRFTPARDFHGVTSVSFEVTDGDGLSDPSAMKARINLNIEVHSAGQSQPVVRPNALQVAPGEAEQRFSLTAMASDPDPGDQANLSYALISVDGLVEAGIHGQELSLKAPADATVGAVSYVTVEVSDGVTAPVPMTIPVTVVSSTRPAMVIPELVERDGRVGSSVSFDLSRLVTNPFADVGGELSLVGTPQLRGPGILSVNGTTISVTPENNSAEEIVVSFRLADATKDPARERSGQIRVIVKDVPATPTGVTATYIGSKTARVSWTHAGWRGATPTGYLVSWNGGSQQCGLQTSCDIPNLSNGARYTFTVTAQVAEEDLNARSQPSAPSNPIWVDALPAKPAPPVAEAGDRQVRLSWSAPALLDGASPVTRYTVTTYPGGATTTTTATNAVISGLANGTSYWFTVTAHNALTDANPQIAAPVSDPSATVVPVGAPAGLQAPSVVMDRQASGVSSRATISWQPPTTANGDDSFSYKVLASDGAQVCAQQQELSCTIDMPPSTANVTFQVVATNRSGLWSQPSPPSEPVRAFAAPSAPASLTVASTGRDGEVVMDLGAASGEGLRPDEISYRWSAGGYSGTLSPGHNTISSPAFAAGGQVTVTVTAIATVLGKEYPGGSIQAVVTLYSPPASPTVSVEQSTNPNQVSVNWSVPNRSNGAAITRVEVRINDEVFDSNHLTGGVSRGSGRSQEFCATARALNEYGAWGPWSTEVCGQTWDPPRVMMMRGTEVECADDDDQTCHRIRLVGERLSPGSPTICTVIRPRTGQSAQVELDAPNETGSVTEEFSVWLFSDEDHLNREGTDITSYCSVNDG